MLADDDDAFSEVGPGPCHLHQHGREALAEVEDSLRRKAQLRCDTGGLAVGERVAREGRLKQLHIRRRHRDQVLRDCGDGHRNARGHGCSRNLLRLRERENACRVADESGDAGKELTLARGITADTSCRRSGDVGEATVG